MADVLKKGDSSAKSLKDKRAKAAVEKAKIKAAKPPKAPKPPRAKSAGAGGSAAGKLGGIAAQALNSKTVIIAVCAALAVIASVVGVVVWEQTHTDFPEHEASDNSIVHNGVVYVPEQNIETFLVMGLDTVEGATTDSYNNDQRADFLMLFVFNNDTKQCSALQVNRDTITNVNILGVAGDVVSSTPMQIALSHTYGHGGDISCRNTANAVSALLNGVKIDHYISVTMGAVPTLNDLVGGVEVSLLEDYTHIDPSMRKGETVTLTGEQALRYVQIRQGLEDQTNTTRMERQQQYINALYAKFQASMSSDSNFAVEVTTAISDQIVSDRSITQLQKLAEKFNEYAFLGIRELEGSSAVQNGFMEFYPTSESITQTVVDLFYKPKD